MQKAKTRTHEIAHALLHTGVEYRNHTPKSLVELEAESVAYCVMSYYSFDTSQYSFGYIATWNSNAKDGLDIVKTAGERIVRTAQTIIKWIDEYSCLSSPVSVDNLQSVE